jgi:predicted ATPase
MIKALQVSNFRVLKRLEVDNLARINLITGKNNAGKTSLLEALFIHLAAPNTNPIVRIQGWRAEEIAITKSVNSDAPSFVWFFHDLDVKQLITIATEYASNHTSENTTTTLKVMQRGDEMVEVYSKIAPQVQDDKAVLTASSADILELALFPTKNPTDVVKTHLISRFNGAFVQEAPPQSAKVNFYTAIQRPYLIQDAERFGNLQAINQDDIVLRLMKKIDPKITRIITRAVGGVPILHLDIGKLIPAPFLGSGASRLLSIALGITNSSDDVVLIDEIDAGLHHSVLVDVWRVLGEIAEAFNVQIFATTHSRECIQAAMSAFSDKPDEDFRVLRLDKRENGDIRVASYDIEALEGAFELELEVRGY